MASFAWTVAEDTNFVVGDSPVTISVNAALVEGYVACDGTGSILVEIAPEGTSYGGQFTIKPDEGVSLGGARISKIRITHSGTDSSYRVATLPIIKV
ncbi:hypothetical protein LCGC14_2675940 [marine sediment metagenome]|uniref:Uncharacterized protein n=1 Tax=marine sediment metagenome TaxID=412755 RepID=A0A0F9BXP2_9ZZZZ